MGRALYRKYRSRSLDEIVGQPHITTTLSNALKNGAISHAYLFTGPKGVGKTSIARILAYEVNGLPYDEEGTHLDIIEIDAASNRRIDEIREIRERVHTAPTSAKYKVYIIDEVHMLTKEAFNALLKTLEEPPAHVIFILATTEAHKLPETIISRTQRYTFKPVDEPQVIAHLKSIAKQEKITIEDEALQLIAQHGGGSFRDSISLLDQVRSIDGTVSLSNVQTMLGIAPDQIVDSLVATMQSGNTAELVATLQSCREQGYQAAQLAKQLASRLRNYLLDGVSPIPADSLTPLLQKLLAIPNAYDQEASLELALLDIVLRQQATPLTQMVNTKQPITPPPELTPEAAPTPVVAKSQPEITSKEPEIKIPKPKKTEEAAPEPTTTVASPKSPKTTSSTTFNEQTWDEALNKLKQTHNTLYSVARMAIPKIDGDEITLVFKFAFHQKRINDTKNKQVLADIVHGLTNRPVTISCVVGETEAKKQPQAAAVASTIVASVEPDTISTISNIFGGAEVLES
jgi:DNA polymerase-3 subunit gamma/tau